MKKLMPGRPSPAMIVAVIALVFAIAGGAYAANKIGLGELSKKAKKKTVGVGKLTYVTTTNTYNTNTPGGFDGYVVTATCPPGTKALGGGTKLVSPEYTASGFFLVEDYISTTGFTSRYYAGSAGQADTVQVTAACGVSQSVSGSPPSA